MLFRSQLAAQRDPRLPPAQILVRVRRTAGQVRVLALSRAREEVVGRLAAGEALEEAVGVDGVDAVDLPGGLARGGREDGPVAQAVSRETFGFDMGGAQDEGVVGRSQQPQGR